MKDRWEVAKMDKQVLVIIALALVLLISGVQAIEIGNLKEAIAEGQITGASAGQQNSDIPAQQSAPAMVGGC